MRPLKVYYQDCISRSHEVADGSRSVLIDIDGWREQLDAIETGTEIDQVRPIVFASLIVAGYIQRNCPSLARGVILPRDFLTHHTYSAIIPEDLLLNPRGIYLPWGRIPAAKRDLSDLFGEHIFIRPDSSMKAFTGFSVKLDELDFEHPAMTQAAHISPDELCFIAPHIDVAGVEYRCWIVESEVITSASYGWEGHEEALGQAPADVVKAAQDVARHIEMREQIFTADLVETSDGPRLVELNAMSTSGWYDAMSPEDLIAGLSKVLV